MDIVTTLLTRPPGRIPQFASERPKEASSAAIAMLQATKGVNGPKTISFNHGNGGFGKCGELLPAPSAICLASACFF